MFFRSFLAAVLLLSSPLVAGSNTHPFAKLIQSAPIQGSFIEKDGKDSSSGLVTLGQGGQLRWERQKPYEELLVASKRKAWHVQPDLNQAIALDIRAVSSWRALMDPKMLGRYYKTTMKDDLILLRRQPQVDSDQWPNMDISLDAKGQLKEITFVDADARTIEFSGWGPAPRVEFDYTPPAGMDVIGRP